MHWQPAATRLSELTPGRLPAYPPTHPPSHCRTHPPAHPPSAQDLAAYWQFNDPETNGLYRPTAVARDASGRGNDLRLVSLPAARRATIEQARPVGPASCGPAPPAPRAHGCPRRHPAWRWIMCTSAHPPGATPLLAALQGGRRLEAGALAFRNNFALQPDWTDMPDK